MPYHHPCQPRKPAPHIAFWMLRLLTSPEGLREFVRTNGFARNNVAFAVGLDHWINPTDCPFDPEAVRAEMYQLLAQAHQARACAPPPAVLRNAQQRAAEIGLEPAGLGILAFAACLRTHPLLREAANVLGPLGYFHTLQTLALVLDMPAKQVHRLLGCEGLLSRTGLVVVNRHGSDYLRAKISVPSKTFADQLVSIDTKTGSSFKTAVVIEAQSSQEGVPLEYEWIESNLPGAELEEQALIHNDEKVYDKMDVVLSSGERRSVYFDITRFFGRGYSA